MINRDIQETKDLQKVTDEILRDFRQDLEDAAEEMDKIDKKERKWQLIVAYYLGILSTILVEAIALLINKGIHS
jgi:hypothetical protein